MTWYSCPTVERYACSWSGASENILEHFQQEHEDLLHFTNTISIDLKMPSENRLMFMDEEIYLLQTKTSSSSVIILLRFLGPQLIANKLTFDISLTVNENIQVAKNKYVFLSEIGGYEINFDKLHETYDNVEVIHCTVKVSDNSRGDNKLSIDETAIFKPFQRVHVARRKKLSSQSMRENLNSLEFPSPKTLNRLSQRRSLYDRPYNINLEPIEEQENDLKCVNCKRVMLPPIYQCDVGHNSCKDCLPQPCGLCGDPVTTTRNFFLEEKCLNHKHTCKYFEQGCTVTDIYREIRKHELRCNNCVFNCPIEACNVKGHFNLIKKHFSLIHNSIKIYDLFIKEFPRNSEFFLINEKNGIFYCKCTATLETITWEVNYCGPNDRTYICELEFRNVKKSEIRKVETLRKLNGNCYSYETKLVELKKQKMHKKNAVLVITQNKDLL